MMLTIHNQHEEALAESWREASRTMPVTIELPAIRNCGGFNT